MSVSFNELNIKKTAYASFTLPNGTTTSNLTSQAVIPKGAIITGIRWVAPQAVTLTGASGTVVLQAGALALMATVNASAMGAVTVPVTTALSAASGIYMTVDGQLNLQCQASSNSAVTATYDFYVDYLFTGLHD
jgi:hypothetical protein